MGTDPFMRLATLEDTEAIEALMRASTAALFPRYYDARQSASAVRHVTRVDTMLIEDGTYFVLESDGELVGCGGWSRRDRLYTGSGDDEGDTRLLDPATEPAKVRAMFVRADWTRRGLGRRIIEECEQAARREEYRELALMASLPGAELYLACGFEPLEEVELELSDGVMLAGVRMAKPIAPQRGASRRGGVGDGLPTALV